MHDQKPFRPSTYFRINSVSFNRFITQGWSPVYCWNSSVYCWNSTVWRQHTGETPKWIISTKIEFAHYIVTHIQCSPWTQTSFYIQHCTGARLKKVKMQLFSIIWFLSVYWELQQYMKRVAAEAVKAHKHEPICFGPPNYYHWSCIYSWIQSPWWQQGHIANCKATPIPGVQLHTLFIRE